jgi:hypothetical protein
MMVHYHYAQDWRHFMVKLPSFMLILVALFGFWNTTAAQEKDFQTAVLQKLNEIDKRIDEMDKRYEVRFTKIEEKLNGLESRLDIKIESVNQRIDDKFNLLVGLLGLIAAFLALPYIPKFLERYKVHSERKEDIQHLQEQINELKAQLSQRPGPAR